MQIKTKKQIQIKINEFIAIEKLLNNGAQFFGHAKQSDIYLLHKKGWRIREESGNYIFSKKDYAHSDKKGLSYSKAAISFQKVISKKEADLLIKKFGVLVVINKSRDIFKYRDATIALDEVEHLGNFTEIIGSKQEDIDDALRDLGLTKRKLIYESYLELVEAKKMPEWLKKTLLFHQKIGELAFGITSGTLTTIGLLTGVNAATSSRLSVIASIAVIAVADSSSDAFGMYMSKSSERGINKSLALRYALGTMLGKVVLPVTFIIPLILLPLNLAVVIDLIWGAFALIVLTSEQAIVSGQKVWKKVAVNLALAIIIIIFSTIVGNLAGRIR